MLWIFVLCSLSPLGLSQEVELKERVRQLEIQVRQLTDELVQLHQALQIQQKQTERLVENPRSQLLYDEVIDSYRQKPQENSLNVFYRQLIHSHIWLGGYIEAKFQDTESAADPNLFDLSRFAFTFRSTLNDYSSVHGEISFSERDKIRVNHAYFLLAIDPAINFKAGVVRVPFARYNSIYSPPSQNLSSRPLVDRYVIPVIWSEPGLSLFGKFEAKAFTCSYEVLASNGLGEDGFSADRGNIDAPQGLRVDNNHQPQWSARLEMVPKLNIEIFSMYVGLSGIIARYDNARNNEFKGGALDWFFKIGPFTLIGDHDLVSFSGEYAYLDIERDRDILQRKPDIVPRMWGYFLQFHYRFFPETWRDEFFLFGDESAFGFSFRYDRIDLDPRKGVSPLDDQRSYTVGLDFYPISQTVFRVEYSWIYQRMGDWAWNNQLQVSFATYF